MGYPIERVRAKVTRAKQHIEDFQLRADDFYKTNPCVVRVQEDPERSQRVYYVAALADIPETLASIAADAVQNLRKPLDYIANRIETLACGTKPKHLVYFPIGRNATHYETVRHAYIRCAGQAAVDAFDAAEPYQGGKGHGLWQLHMLNRPDKHDFPLAIAAGYTAFDVSGMIRDQLVKAGADIPLGTMPPVLMRPQARGPLKVGDPLFAEPLDLEVHEERKFLIEVSLNEPGVIDCEAALPALQNYANLVDGIVTAFEPLL